MIREVKLPGARTVSAFSSSVQPATSPYPFAGTGSIAVHDAWNTVDAGGDATGTFAYCWPGNGGNEHLVGFDPAPTLALFNQVSFSFGADYSKTGPNTWWFPPDNAFGPRVRVVMLARDGIARHYSPAYQFDPGVEDNFVNISTSPTIYKLHTVTWDLTSHPEGGPFTLEDINKLVAGVDITTSNGPNGKAFETGVGSFFKIRIPWFTLTLTVEDLGGYVRAIRHNGSAALRLMRRPRNTVSMSMPAHEATKEIGEVVNLAHGRGPDAEGAGWGVRALDRRSVQIVQRTYWPEDLRVADVAFDLHDFSCEAWTAFRIPIAWTPELSGLAYLDRGGEWTMTRAQDAWSLRPGDGAAVRVLEDYPNLSEEGLAVHAAGGTEILLNNSNPAGTGWASDSVSGGLTLSTETDAILADELGYQTAVRLTFGGSPGAGGKAQVVALTVGDSVSIRARVRNLALDNPSTKFLEAAFFDSSGNYWSAAAGTWVAAPTYNPIPADQGYGEVIFDQIPINNTENHTLKVGRFSSSINTATFVIALASIQKNAHGCGMPLVTLGSTIARVADSFVYNNSSTFVFWHRASGMAIVEFRPFWRGAAMAAATSKPIIRADHSAGAFDLVEYKAGTPDRFIATRSDGSGVKTVEVAIRDAAGGELYLTRAHYVRLFYRWLDSPGWRDHPPYEAAIGYAVYLAADDSFVSYHEATATWAIPNAETESSVTLANLDGWVRWLEVKRNPLTGQEAIWRR